MTDTIGAPAPAIDEFLADSVVRETLCGVDQTGDAIPEDLYHECGSRGIFALSVPARYGGLELPLTRRVALHETIAQASASLQSVLTVHEMAVYAITRFGNAQLAQRWLPVMASGECAGAFALTEPAGGSSQAQMHTTVTETGDSLRLDGVKTWISSGMRAGVIIVFARAADGAVALCVPGDSPGLGRTAGPAISGMSATSMANLHLDGCRVEPASRLGTPGLGLVRVANACLTVGRVLVAAGAIGVAAAAALAMMTHANRRVVGTKKLAEHPLVRRAVADAHIGIRAGRLLTTEAARAVDERAPAAVQHAIAAKLAAAQAAQTTTRDAVRLHGAAGLTVESAVRRYAAQAQVYGCIEGSAEALAPALGAALLRAGAADEEDDSA